MDFTSPGQFLPAIKKLEKLLEKKGELKTRIRAIGEKYRSYAIAENIYKVIYDINDN